jgi:hypothetical protein
LYSDGALIICPQKTEVGRRVIALGTTIVEVLLRGHQRAEAVCCRAIVISAVKRWQAKPGSSEPLIPA